MADGPSVSFVRPSVRSFVDYLFVCLFVFFLVRSLVRSFVRSFVRSHGRTHGRGQTCSAKSAFTTSWLWSSADGC